MKKVEKDVDITLLQRHNTPIESKNADEINPNSLRGRKMKKMILSCIECMMNNNLVCEQLTSTMDIERLPDGRFTLLRKGQVMGVINL